MNLHELEELEFGQSGPLWDADPSVCCAAFQLGACEHTENDQSESTLMKIQPGDSIENETGKICTVSVVTETGIILTSGRGLAADRIRGNAITGFWVDRTAVTA